MSLLKPNVRADFGRRGEGEEEGHKELGGRKAVGQWEGNGVPSLAAAVGWKRFVTSHRAPRSGAMNGYIGRGVGEEWWRYTKAPPLLLERRAPGCWSSGQSEGRLQDGVVTILPLPCPSLRAVMGRLPGRPALTSWPDHVRCWRALVGGCPRSLSAAAWRP